MYKRTTTLTFPFHSHPPTPPACRRRRPMPPCDVPASSSTSAAIVSLRRPPDSTAPPPRLRAGSLRPASMRPRQPLSPSSTPRCPDAPFYLVFSGRRVAQRRRRVLPPPRLCSVWPALSISSSPAGGWHNGDGAVATAAGSLRLGFATSPSGLQSSTSTTVGYRAGEHDTTRLGPFRVVPVPA
jgi:hypothetical protein